VIGSPPLSYRQIRIGRFAVGLSGLNETFTTLYREGFEPDESAVPALMAHVRQQNYVPPAAEAEYVEALLREFRRFCEQMATGCGCAVDYGTWRGHPREAIPWYPTVRADLCDGCGACLRFCTFDVYATTDDGKVEVVEPFKCVVGCSACAQICRPGAIAFPPREVLQAF